MMKDGCLGTQPRFCIWWWILEILCSSDCTCRAFLTDRFIPLTLTTWWSCQGLESEHQASPSASGFMRSDALGHRWLSEGWVWHRTSLKVAHRRPLRTFIPPFYYFLSSVVKAEIKAWCIQAKGKANQKFVVLWPASGLRDFLNVPSLKQISRRGSGRHANVCSICFSTDYFTSSPSKHAENADVGKRRTVLWAHGKTDLTFLASKPDRNNCIRA